MRTYVMSDIHGQYRSFCELLSYIDLENGDKLILLGDYVDWGLEGVQVIQSIMRMQKKYPKQVVALLGNHDHMMLTPFYDGYMNYKDIPIDYYDSWLERNGGWSTYDRFHRISSEEQTIILHWLWNLPVAYKCRVNGKRFIMAHAFPSESSNFIEKEEAVWSRKARDNSSLIEEFPDYDVIITGHNIVKNIVSGINQPILRKNGTWQIDCGAKCLGYDQLKQSQTACLCMVCLDDQKIFWSRKVG